MNYKVMLLDQVQGSLKKIKSKNYNDLSGCVVETRDQLVNAVECCVSHIAALRGNQGEALAKSCFAELMSILPYNSKAEDQEPEG